MNCARRRAIWRALRQQLWCVAASAGCHRPTRSTAHGSRALARRIGKPLQVASERPLADGSRMVRFVGNVCLRVPRNLPMGFENAFGPTVVLPTNCSD